MKLVTWNCNGALRKKLQAADRLQADILVVQECENPSESTELYREWAGNYLWVGENKNKGIGIFPKNGYSIDRLEWSGHFKIDGLISSSLSLEWRTEDLKLFLPFRVNDELTLLACWTKGNDSQAFGYMGQFWKYLQIHRNELNSDNTIILGDFNSNAVWDKPDRWWSHTDTVNELGKMGLSSLYHEIHKEEQGNESTATFFLHRKTEKPYHIDYVFASSNLIESSLLSVGDYSEWLQFSDHMPLIAEIDM